MKAVNARSYMSIQLRDPGDPHINMGDFIPGGKICNAGLGQSEYVLELPYSGGSLLAVDAVCLDPGDGCVYLGNSVQLLLQLAYFIAGTACCQVISRPGSGDAGDLLCCVDVHAVAIVVAQDLNGAVALLA